MMESTLIRQDSMSINIIKMEKKLKKELDEERYQHTLGVMFTAASLAMCYGADIERAQAAGLLHDCAKCIPNDKKIKMCEQYGIEINKTERRVPSLLHSKLGAYLAKSRYGIDDPEVLSAIQYHTTGKPNMTVLEKIIFIADYIEPMRFKAKNLAAIRKMAFHDLNQTVCMILEDTLHYLDEGQGEVDEMSRSAFRYYYNLFHDTEDDGSSLTR